MMGKTILLATSALIASSLLASPAMAQVSQSEYDALKARVDELEKKNDEASSTATDTRTRLSTLEQSASYTSWTYDNGRPTVSTGDGRFSLAIRGRFQFDAASFMQDPAKYPYSQYKDLSSGAVVRRAYFGVEGKVYKDWWYEFRLNFGGSNAEGAELNLARVAYTGIPGFRVNLGVIQPVFTYGDTVSSGSLVFIEKDPIVNVAAANFGGSDARRGIELSYQKAGFFTPSDYFFIAGSYTGSTTGNSNGHGYGFDEQTQINGRAGYRFWQDGVSSAQIGVSAAHDFSVYTGATPNALSLSERPGIRVDATSLVSTGTITNVNSATMYGIDGAANYENFYVASEYHKYKVDRFSGSDPEFSGWYAEGSWVITGEPKQWGASATNNEIGSWGAPAVIKPFSLDGNSWGAWELAAKYSTLDLNWNQGVVGSALPTGGVRGGQQNIWTAGVNWYPNRNVRFMFDFERVDINKIGSVTLGATTYNNVQIGQKFNVLAARMQFAF